VTHHGSRKPGALLYKYGMSTAEGFRQKPRRRRRGTMPGFRRTPARAKTIGRLWQIIRAWTKASHFKIHEYRRRASRI